MKITPLGNRLVVSLTKQSNVTASGIITSVEEKAEQAMGKIISIGTGYGTEENIKDLPLEVGQTVLFGKYAGEEVKDNEETYKIIKGTDVLAIINP